MCILFGVVSWHNSSYRRKALPEKVHPLFLINPRLCLLYPPTTSFSVATEGSWRRSINYLFSHVHAGLNLCTSWTQQGVCLLMPYSSSSEKSETMFILASITFFFRYLHFAGLTFMDHWEWLVGVCLMSTRSVGHLSAATLPRKGTQWMVQEFSTIEYIQNAIV